AVERLALCQVLVLDEFQAPGVTEALAGLERRNLIRLDESGSRIRISLTHPHYAAAVRDSLPRIRAISLLLEQADILEGLLQRDAAPAAGSDTYERGRSAAAELRVAIWRLDAGRTADPAMLLRAAELARQAQDSRTAARLVEAAIAGGAYQAEIYMMHAELMWALGRGAQALDSLANAELAARSEPESQAMLVAIAARRAEV
ncbi:MAG: hypothetical protein J0H64_02200, partial [Actinobacteria bacterium]|nr:hypothetical protein [Actinomycetota bacterium]